MRITTLREAIRRMELIGITTEEMAAAVGVLCSARADQVVALDAIRRALRPNLDAFTNALKHGNEVVAEYMRDRPFYSRNKKGKFRPFKGEWRRRTNRPEGRQP